jgi:hypothetical protein
MAFMKENPSTKKHLTPILQTVMKRAQLLKGEVAVAAKVSAAASTTVASAGAVEEEGDDDDNDGGGGGGGDDPLPKEIRIQIKAAKKADVPGHESEAVAMYEGAAREAMVYLKANPSQKSELTPTLQGLIMRTRALKQILTAGE